MVIKEFRQSVLNIAFLVAYDVEWSVLEFVPHKINFFLEGLRIITKLFLGLVSSESQWLSIPMALILLHQNLSNRYVFQSAFLELIQLLNSICWSHEPRKSAHQILGRIFEINLLSLQVVRFGLLLG